MQTLSERINRLFAEEKWPAARKLIERALQREPQDHWLLARLASIHYEERDYETAQKIARQAERLQPDCPLVQWELAGALHMLGKPGPALRIYRGLLQRGLKSVGHDECGEGEEWAISLLTDCLFRMGLCYQGQGKNAAALRAFRKHLELRGMGANSIYPVDEARQRIQKVAGSCRRILVQELEAVGKTGA